MEELQGRICILYSLNGKLPDYHKIYLKPATVHEYHEQIMVMGSPYFIFFDKKDMYEKMMSLRTVYFNENNPERTIKELIFNGTPAYTVGEIITINPIRECKISIHRYSRKKFIFIVLIDKKV